MPRKYPIRVGSLRKMQLNTCGFDEAGETMESGPAATPERTDGVK
jgi:hypothetical protein